MKKTTLLCATLLALTLMGRAEDDVIAAGRKTGEVNTCIMALNVAGQSAVLKGNGPFTVFAPNDAAFAKLPKDTLYNLLKPENKQKLVNLLTYHIINGAKTTSDLTTMKAPTLNGATLDINVTNGVVTVNDAHVIKADVKASNGVVYVIDKVLFPPGQ
jgi:uncharacterized surface protein with fasciclin (FAS1) repeats